MIVFYWPKISSKQLFGIKLLPVSVDISTIFVNKLIYTLTLHPFASKMPEKVKKTPYKVNIYIAKYAIRNVHVHVHFVHMNVCVHIHVRCTFMRKRVQPLPSFQMHPDLPSSSCLHQSLQVFYF